MTFHSDLIPAHGGYRNLKSFQVAQLVYDVTVRFPRDSTEFGVRKRNAFPKNGGMTSTL